MQKETKIILGIDPGTVVMGYGLIKADSKGLKLLEMGVLKMSSKTNAHDRLKTIHEKVCALIKQFKPSEMAIEAPFFGKNVQSMLKLGRAQGVAIAAGIQGGLIVAEYAPKKIKQSITGNGNADKIQVMKMLQKLMPLEEKPEYLDASDALAAAVCHHFQGKHTISSGKNAFKNWESYLEKNPQRIRK